MPCPTLKPLVLALALLTPLIGHAQAPPSLPAWEQLTSEQRERLIAPIQDRWNNATPEQRTRMLARAERWQQMVPDDRRRIRGAIGHLQELPSIRHHELRALFHHLRTLPDAEHADFMRRWLEMSPEQRREWAHAHPAPPHDGDSRRTPEHHRTGHSDAHAK